MANMLPAAFFLPLLPLSSSLTASIALTAVYGETICAMDRGLLACMLAPAQHAAAAAAACRSIWRERPCTAIPAPAVLSAGIISLYSYGLFGVWKYAPYLSSALGAGGECHCCRCCRQVHQRTWSYPRLAERHRGWIHSEHLLHGSAGKFTGFLLRSIFLANHDMNVWAAATVFLTAGEHCRASRVGMPAVANRLPDRQPCPTPWFWSREIVFRNRSSCLVCHAWRLQA